MHTAKAGRRIGDGRSGGSSGAARLLLPSLTPPPLPALTLVLQLYKPLEFLFLVAAFTTLAENFLPQLMSLPKSIVQTVVRSTLSLTFVIAAARVVFNIKGR